MEQFRSEVITNKLFSPRISDANGTFRRIQKVIFREIQEVHQVNPTMLSQNTTTITTENRHSFESPSNLILIQAFILLVYYYLLV